MSVLGMIRRLGAIADVYRPTATVGTGGLADVTWPTGPVSSNVRGIPDVIADELARKIFGHEVAVELRLLVAPATDIAKDDGVVFRTCTYAGERFRVTSVVPSTVPGRSAQLEVALERTTEAFG